MNKKLLLKVFPYLLIVGASIFYLETRINKGEFLSVSLDTIKGVVSTREADAQFCVQNGPCNWQNWMCDCSGRFGGGSDAGGTTFCMKCINGEITKIAVAKQPYTKMNGFNCGNNVNPQGTGALPDNDPVTVWNPHGN